MQKARLRPYPNLFRLERWLWKSRSVKQSLKSDLPDGFALFGLCFALAAILDVN